jgi:hypothetical protein
MAGTARPSPGPKLVVPAAAPSEIVQAAPVSLHKSAKRPLSDGLAGSAGHASL